MIVMKIMGIFLYLYAMPDMGIEVELKEVKQNLQLNS